MVVKWLANQMSGRGIEQVIAWADVSALNGIGFPLSRKPSDVAEAPEIDDGTRLLTLKEHPISKRCDGGALSAAGQVATSKMTCDGAIQNRSDALRVDQLPRVRGAVHDGLAVYSGQGWAVSIERAEHG